MKAAVEVGGDGGAVCRTLGIAGAPAFLSSTLPEDDPVAAVHILQHKRRLLLLLGELAKAQIPFGASAAAMRAALDLKREYDARDEDGEEIDQAWSELNSALIGFLRHGKRAGYALAEAKTDKFEQDIEDLKKQLSDEKKKVKEERKKLEEERRKREEERKATEEEKRRADQLQAALSAAEAKVREMQQTLTRVSEAVPRTGSIASINSLLVSFSNPKNIRTDKNTILHAEPMTYESCLVGSEMRTVWSSCPPSFYNVSTFIREYPECFTSSLLFFFHVIIIA